MNDDSHLLTALEPAQFTAAARARLPRKQLGRAAVSLLILLRIYVMIAVPLVCYAFAHAVLASKGP